jgi:hypothetical protein
MTEVIKVLTVYWLSGYDGSRGTVFRTRDEGKAEEKRDEYNRGRNDYELANGVCYYVKEEEIKIE